MKIEKTLKAIKAAERLKKYCSKHETCKDCVFHSENSRYIYACMIRRVPPEEYDLEEITRGLTSE